MEFTNYFTNYFTNFHKNNYVGYPQSLPDKTLLRLRIIKHTCAPGSTQHANISKNKDPGNKFQEG